MPEHESQQRTPNTGIIIAWHPAATRPWCCQRLRAALVAGVGGRRTNQTLPQSKKEAVVGGPAVAGSTRREHASSNRRLKGWFDLLPYLALPGARGAAHIQPALRDALLPVRVEGRGPIALPPPPLPAATVPGARAARKHGGDGPQVEVVLWRPADRETAAVPSSAPRATTAAAEVGSPRPSVTAGWSWTARAEQWLEQAREAGSRRNPETGEASGRKKKALDAEIFTGTVIRGGVKVSRRLMIGWCKSFLLSWLS